MTRQATRLVSGGSRVAQKLKQMSNGEGPEANGKTDGQQWVLIDQQSRLPQLAESRERIFLAGLELEQPGFESQGPFQGC